MEYPSGLLAPGETVAFQMRPHFRALLGPAVKLVIVLAAGGWLYLQTDWQWVHTGLLVTGAILVIAFSIIPILRWLTTQYVFTDRRIIVRSGLITRHGRDMPLAALNNVSFRISLLGRILNYGTLEIQSASDSKSGLIIRNVSNVEEIQQRIHELVQEDEGRRRNLTGGPPDSQ